MANTKIIQSNIVEESTKDYQRYSIKVNRARMIPDIRDGLKPVHRRIIDVMYNHLNCVKHTFKSARIVGSVIGISHPHGDCLQKNTMLYSIDGNQYRIGDLYDNGINSIYVLGVDPNTNDIIPVLAHSIRIGQYAKKLYHITFSNGYTLTCTSNHPIRTIDGSWIKAEDIKPGMIPYRKPIRHRSGRPAINNELIQDLVYTHFFGPLPEGYVKHHIDGNPNNNLPSNFQAVLRSEHVKHHYETMDVYSDNLEKGRKKMFEMEGPIRERTREKNSKLASLYNKDQGIRRFKHAIGILIENGLNITEENYESLRGSVYNLPKIDRLIEKGYGNTFEDLVNLQLPSISELYQQDPVDDVNIIDPIMFVKDNEDDFSPLSMYQIFNAFDRIIMENGYINYQLYYNNTQTNLLEYGFNIHYQRYLKEYPIISNVSIEELDEPEPMYDFTVDNYENMLIPMGVNEYGSTPMLCIHNSSVYDAMKPMANWFEIKVPMIEGQGNFGTIQGDEQAAMRYTEAKLSDYAIDCIISDLKECKNVVDWIPTYDEKNMEPEYFPVSVPNLLINGAFGIGFGIKSDIPKHNVNDVIDATINLIKNPDYEVVLIPDHCMPVEIVNTNFKSICNKGRGSYTARGIIDIEEDNKGRQCLVIKSTPDLVFLLNVQEKISKMIEDNSLPVVDINEEHGDGKMRLVIILKKGADPNYCKELIYNRTDMQKRYTVNFEVLDRLEPIRMSYKSYLQSFIDFRKLCKFRLYCNKLQDVETKYHEKDAFIKLLQSGKINEIISMIQNRNEIDDTALVEYLIKTLKITDLQASYIINANIKKLSLGYLNKYIDEAKELSELKDQYMAKVLDESLLVEEIIQELKMYKKKYGKPRTSKVVDAKHGSDIPEGEFRVIFTKNNFVKKLPAEFDNGKFKQDYPTHVIVGSNTKALLIFDDQGRVFRLPIHRIFVSDKNSNGIDIRTIIKNCTANIIKVIYEPLIEDLAKKTTKYYITTVTNNGTIKKMDLEDFMNVPASGLLYTKLDGDIVSSVNIYHESVDVIVFSKNKALRMSMGDIPYQRRNTKGMKSISSGQINGTSFIVPGSKELLVVTENGYINRIDIVALPNLGRNKPGTSVIKLGKDDAIHAIHSIGSNKVANEFLKVTTNNEIIEIPINDISVSSSISKGVKLIPLKNDNIISTSIK